MAAQGVHATTGNADIAEQELHDGRGTYHFRTLAMLGPAKCIHHGHGFVRHCRGRNHFAHFEEFILRCAGDPADHFRCVARIMMLHYLQYATRMLQRRVDFGKAFFIQLVTPALIVIAALGFVVTGEQAIGETVFLADYERGIGIVFNVFLLDFIIAEQVVEHATEEGDITACTDRRIVVAHRSRAREARIDNDQLGLVVMLGFNHPFETARVCFGRIATHD
ncbi:hypothetical protein D3C81_1612030 [compost metagenome]